MPVGAGFARPSAAEDFRPDAAGIVNSLRAEAGKPRKKRKQQDGYRLYSKHNEDLFIIAGVDIHNSNKEERERDIPSPVEKNFFRAADYRLSGVTES
jgi:hypothetical protein